VDRRETMRLEQVSLPLLMQDLVKSRSCGSLSVMSERRTSGYSAVTRSGEFPRGLNTVWGSRGGCARPVPHR